MQKINLIKNYFPKIIFIIFLLLFTGCFWADTYVKDPKVIRILDVPYNECVPDDLFDVYVENMWYKAMTVESEERKIKLKWLEEIREYKKGGDILSAKIQLEKYRKEYGYGNCNIIYKETK
jgi:hypothetical protein